MDRFPPPSFLAVGSLALACVALTQPALAQLGAPAPGAPFAGGSSHRLDATTAIDLATGQLHDAVLGAARDAQGRYWLTARRPDRNASHVLVELDAAGNFVTVHQQPAAVDAASAWGIRDLAYDGQRLLYGGSELDRIVAFDTVSRAWDPSRDVPVPAGLTFGTMRALAFDPQGDGGNGSLWTASWDSEHVELSLQGAVLRRVPNLQPETFGAAYDPIRRTVWWFGQAGSARGVDTHVVATEMETTGATPTGQRVLGDLTRAGIAPGGHAGGVEMFERGGRAVLLTVAQGDSDWLVELDGRFGYGTSSGAEASFAGGAAFAGNQSFALTLEHSIADLAVPLLALAPTDLPIPAGIGFAPGSRLLIDGTQWLVSLPTAAVAQPLGSARSPLPLPADPALAGVDLHCQWIEVRLVGGVPTLPLLTSRAGSLRIAP